VRLTGGFALALGLAVATAHALQPPASHADDQFANAKDRYDKGDYAGALALFRVAFGETSSPNARLYIARSLRELGKTVEAYQEMKATVQDAKARADAEARYAKTRDAAAAELGLLELRVARLLVAVDPATPNAAVTLNDAPLPVARLGAFFPVEPGKLRVVATADGRGQVAQEVELAGGQEAAVVLTFPPAAGHARGPARVVTRSDGAVRTLGFVHLGVGAAGLVTLMVAGLLASDKESELDETCGERRCTDPAAAEIIDDGKTLQTIANVGLGVGIVGVLAGTAMVIFGGPSDEDEDAPAVVIEPGPGAGLGVRARF
jgi:hypothetical protein